MEDSLQECLVFARQSLNEGLDRKKLRDVLEIAGYSSITIHETINELKRAGEYREKKKPVISDMSPNPKNFWTGIVNLLFKISKQFVLILLMLWIIFGFYAAFSVPEQAHNAWTSVLVALEAILFGLLIKLFVDFSNNSSFTNKSENSWNRAFLTGVIFTFIAIFLGLSLLWFLSITAIIMISGLMLFYNLDFTKALSLYIFFIIIDWIIKFLIEVVNQKAIS